MPACLHPSSPSGKLLSWRADVADDDTIQLRVVQGDSSLLDNYEQTDPTITVEKGAASYSITGDVTATLSMAAAFAVGRVIAGDVTASISMAAALAVGREIAGDLTAALSMVAVMDYTRNASIAGAVTINASSLAGMIYNLHAELAGAATVTPAIAATMQYQAAGAGGGHARRRRAAWWVDDYSLDRPPRSGEADRWELYRGKPMGEIVSPKWTTLSDGGGVVYLGTTIVGGVLREDGADTLLEFWRDDEAGTGPPFVTFECQAGDTHEPIPRYLVTVAHGERLYARVSGAGGAADLRHY